MRGGVSKIIAKAVRNGGSSPHAWGCFRNTTSISLLLLVFPTCVGVFLSGFVIKTCKIRLPHMRGGVSRLEQAYPEAVASSPHAWGCFCGNDSKPDRACLFLTCVGVFLKGAKIVKTKVPLSHMRGGVSTSVHHLEMSYNCP